MDVGRLAVVVQTSWSHNLDGWRLSSYHPSQRNVTWPICRFSRNAAVLASARLRPFSAKRKFAVYGQTQGCRFRPNASLPFSDKRKFAVFGQTQVCRFRPNASLPFSDDRKFAVSRPTHLLANVMSWPKDCVCEFRDCDEGVALRSKG